MTTPVTQSYIVRPDRRVAPPTKGYTREVYLAEIAIRGVAYGDCWCGCGGKTAVATDTDRSNWKLTGLPRMYIRGHSTSLRANPEYVEEDRGFRTPCWIWMRGRGTENKYGLQYGVARRPGESTPISAQRFMYEHLIGPVPEGYDIDHRCRVTLCVNPDHLEAVTHEENVRRGGNAKLSEERVREIFLKRASGRTFRSLAEEYGIHLSHAMQILYGKKWKGVGDTLRVEDCVFQVGNAADKRIGPRLNNSLTKSALSAE